MSPLRGTVTSRHPAPLRSPSIMSPPRGTAVTKNADMNVHGR